MQGDNTLGKVLGNCDKNKDLSQVEGRFWGYIGKDENEMSKKAMHTDKVK